jgi:hypothetical protein
MTADSSPLTALSTRIPARHGEGHARMPAVPMTTIGQLKSTLSRPSSTGATPTAAAATQTFARSREVSRPTPGASWMASFDHARPKPKGNQPDSLDTRNRKLTTPIHFPASPTRLGTHYAEPQGRPRTRGKVFRPHFLPKDASPRCSPVPAPLAPKYSPVTEVSRSLRRGRACRKSNRMAA